jgi:transposase InsO family protein
VKLHRNAKTTPLTRAVVHTRVKQEGWSVRETATAFGVSRQTIYRWLGRDDFDDRSSRPHRQPRRTPRNKVTQILAARAGGLPAWRIAVRVQVPRSTVSLVLARAGVNRLRPAPPPGPVQRYERTRVGELVHLDMKRLGRIGVVGHRIHGDRTRRRRGVGWETVHVCVDDYSRVAYVEVLPDQSAAATASFVRRAAQWFARRGVRLERVMTDNGPGYVSRRFQAALTRLGVKWKRIRPYRPQTNGKAERFIQTLVREWAHGVPYRTSARRTRALPAWLRYYNTQRPHAALQYESPVFRFKRAAQ